MLDDASRLVAWSFRKQMMFELWSNQKYDSFMVDSRPRSVVLNIFVHILPFYQTRSPDLPQYTQWCSL